MFVMYDLQRISFRRSQSAADTVSHPSLLISDDEEPPVLSPQKVPDVNGNLLMRNNNVQDPELIKTPSMDTEIKALLEGTAMELMPEAVGQVAQKSSSKTKAMEFSARLMGVAIPETNANKAWKEHPIIKMSREEVNSRFADMQFGAEAEKRLGCPPPAQAAKIQTMAASETLSGTEMSRLPHSLRTEIPAGAKIETVEVKSKLPRVVEEEMSTLLWNSVRILEIKFKTWSRFLSNLKFVFDLPACFL